MTDVFISYSTEDSKFARWVHDRLVEDGVRVFLAEMSLKPGQTWDKTILGNLKAADYFLFLASRKACTSQYVNQEIGAAISHNKRIIPVVWDMPSSDLPGFLKRVQACDMRSKDPRALMAVLGRVARTIKRNKVVSAMVAGLIIAALLWAFCRKK
ncbi:MAG: toll/interleukin-1 receptor domain-containing protein [Verrucomicrobia bacterium]|nr:toll/interleukin-1 receptor domain-containing protein [Verrucomicrobiota bacterium]